MWQFMTYLYINPVVLIPFLMMTSSNGNIFRVTGHLCGEFPAQRPVTRSFDVFFDLRLNKSLSKQWWGWWFETLLRPLWRHCTVACMSACVCGCLLSVHDDVMTWKFLPHYWSFVMESTGYRSIHRQTPLAMRTIIFFSIVFLNELWNMHTLENAVIWDT